jgi:hypothetical protein
MRLPLFVQSLSVPSDSAYVLLGAGDWEVELDNIDSILNLKVGEILYEAITNGLKLSIQSPSSARASIVQVGTEKHITLYLNDLT